MGPPSITKFIFVEHQPVENIEAKCTNSTLERKERIPNPPPFPSGHPCSSLLAETEEEKLRDATVRHE